MIGYVANSSLRTSREMDSVLRWVSAMQVDIIVLTRLLVEKICHRGFTEFWKVIRQNCDRGIGWMGIVGNYAVYIVDLLRANLTCTSNVRYMHLHQ